MIFENNNKKVVKHLAKSSLRTNKLTSMLTILTIALSTCLIFSIGLIMFETEQLHKNTQLGKAQIAIIGATDKQIENLEQKPEVEWVGESISLGFSYQKDITLNVMYANENQLKKQNHYNYTGRYPINEDEIMLPQNYLDHFNMNVKIGDKVALDLKGTGDTKQYFLTGIVELNTKTDNYVVWVSKKTAKTLSQDDSLSITAYTRLRTDAIESSKIMDYAEQSIQSTGIQQPQLMLTEYFAVMSGVDRQGATLYIFLFGSIILLLAGMLIYGIFYSSVTKNVRNYGQLRTIGMTKKQVKKMVNKEGLYLAIKSIPCGLIIGLIIGYIAHPKGFEIKTAIIWSATVSILVILMVRFSMKTPVKIAANTSPVESSRYLAYTEGKMSKHTHRLTPINLAIMNLGRNRKKTILTISMLSLSGIILVTTSILSSSLNAEKKAKFKYFPYGEIQLHIQSIAQSTFDKKAKIEPYRDTRLQFENNPLSNAVFIEELKQINGVKTITPCNAVRLSITSNDVLGGITTISDNIPTITKDWFEKIRPFLKKTLNYDEITNKNGILIAEDVGSIGNIYTINGREANGKTFEIEAPVMGVYSKTELMEKHPIVPGSPEFMITYDSIKNLTGIKDQTGIISVSVEPEKLNQVISAIKIIADQSNKIDMYTINENIRVINVRYNQITKTLYFISGILFLFGIVSLANVVLTNIATRMQEFGLLHAISMTKSQIMKMLKIENLFYTFGTIVSSLCFGTLIGVILCNRIDIREHSIAFHYPWLIILLLIFSLSIVQIILSFYTKKVLKSDTAIEKIQSSN